LRRVGFFIDLLDAEWLDFSRVVAMISEVEPISIALARSMIVLGDESLVDRYCSELSCVSPQEVPRLRAVLNEGLKVFRDTLLDSVRRVAWDSSDLDSVIKAVSSCADEASHYMDRLVSVCETTSCRDVKGLACFIPRGAIRVDGSLVEAPAILVNLAGVERMVEDVARAMLGERDRSYRDFEVDTARHRLLAALVAHEVTHAYTDLSAGEAPRKRLARDAPQIYHQIIEEGLAMHFAIQTLLSSRSDLVNSVLLAKLLENQPPEYRAGLAMYYYLSDVDRELLALWTRMMMPPGSTVLQLAPLIHAAILAPAKYSVATRVLLYPSRLVDKYLRHMLLRKLDLLLSAALGMKVEYLEGFLWRVLALWLATSVPQTSLRI